MSLISDCAIISDLHLTANERDEYRWECLEWLRGLLAASHVPRLFILGDLTDAKDYHSSKLVNRVVELVQCFVASGLEVWILRGNHDGIDPEYPYFRFLNSIDKVTFVHQPAIYDDVLFLPHERDSAAAWAEWDFSKVPTIFMHATLDGAVSENGMRLGGIDRALLKNATGKIFSGDIHVPQTVGPVEYIGAPYHIRFGDSFVPRAVLFRHGKRMPDIKPPYMKRFMFDINHPKELQATSASAGDQVKVRLHLTASAALDWAALRRQVIDICTKIELDLCGLEMQVEKTAEKMSSKVITAADPKTTFADFCAHEKIAPDLQDMGEFLLEETK
jgi:UDP-2,3-diacylglucosamine pyrophosphatase LpxH